MKTVRILLQDFHDAIDYVRARPGQYPVPRSGQLEILLSDLFTEEYQIKFVGQYLTRNKNNWLERACRIAQSTRSTKSHHTYGRRWHMSSTLTHLFCKTNWTKIAKQLALGNGRPPMIMNQSIKQCIWSRKSCWQ